MEPWKRVAAAFPAEALAEFRVLVDAWGFREPDRTSSGVCYESGDLTVEIERSGEREGYILVYVSRMIGQQYVRADLACLLTTCKLGSAQDVGSVHVRSLHSLRKSLRKQRGAVELVIERLRNAPDRDNLLEGCSHRP